MEMNLFNLNVNKAKLEKVNCNKFFEEELETLNTPRVLEYYKYIINNINIDSLNIMNSYVMWLVDKTDYIDISLPCSITQGYVSLPDIDIDVPAEKRDEIITYIKDRYGHGNVSQMLTFGRLQGRSAIKEVLRVHEACGFSEMNEITKYIPDEAAISDQLQEMDEDERSIIMWALINHPNELRDFCHVNEAGEIDGEYAEYFRQAIAIEGTFKNQGKHAAGVVISAQPLKEACPMVNQRNGEEKIAGLEMADLEALGHVKFDVLGLSLLSKIMKIKELNQNKIVQGMIND
jgi:DNA polymerase-3 subunit alpha